MEPTSRPDDTTPTTPPAEQQADRAPRQPWVAPRIDSLPPLTQLTLQTGP